MIFMTFSFLWWFSIVKAPNVKKKKQKKQKTKNKTKQANENKGKGKEERNKIHCKGNKRGCSKMNIFQRLP